jgi:hypothetical protein
MSTYLYNFSEDLYIAPSDTVHECSFQPSSMAEDYEIFLTSLYCMNAPV